MEVNVLPINLSADAARLKNSANSDTVNSAASDTKGKLSFANVLLKSVIRNGGSVDNIESNNTKAKSFVQLSVEDQETTVPDSFLTLPVVTGMQFMTNINNGNNGVNSEITSGFAAAGSRNSCSSVTAVSSDNRSNLMSKFEFVKNEVAKLGDLTGFHPASGFSALKSENVLDMSTQTADKTEDMFFQQPLPADNAQVKTNVGAEKAGQVIAEAVKQTSKVSLPLTVAVFQQVNVATDVGYNEQTVSADDFSLLPQAVSPTVSKVYLSTISTSHYSTGSNLTDNDSSLAEQKLGESNKLDVFSDKQLQSFEHALQQFNKQNRLEETDLVSARPQQSIQPDSNNIIGQIVEHARLFKSPEMSEMIIKLKPEHLGELTLKVAVDNGVVSATFHSNNSEVRGIIESSVQQLRQDMAQQGLKVEYVGVYAGLGQPFSNGQGEANKQQLWKTFEIKKSDSDSFIESLESVEMTGLDSAKDGIDYRV